MPNPSGLCMCGCGQTTPLAKRSDRRSGAVAGQHTRFIHSHGGHRWKPWSHEERVARFWGKVDVPPEDDACWTWTGSKARSGYGRFTDHGPEGKRDVYAHRFAYEVWAGPIGSGLFVCHTCDEPSCVNPLHLFLGTHQDNMDDQHAKGRRPVGSACGAARLNEGQVAEIRVRASRGESQGSLADAFGVSRAAVGLVVNRRTWRHVS